MIEDDVALHALLKQGLENEGFVVAGTLTGKDAAELCRRESPDLVLLDILLPDVDGFEVLRTIRSRPDMAHVPVIFLTALDSEIDRIVGLELGANDYVVKPFYLRELIARIRVQLRTRPPSSEHLRFRGLELQRESCKVSHSGAPIPLSATEFRLLEFLMTNPGVVFSREQLLAAVWKHERAITGRTVDVTVLRIRQKIERSPFAHDYILSVRGVGYGLQIPSSTPIGETASAHRPRVAHREPLPL